MKLLKIFTGFLLVCSVQSFAQQAPPQDPWRDWRYAHVYPILQALRPDFATCYGSMDIPESDGINLAWTVESDGSVSHISGVSVSSRYQDAADCVSKKLKNLRFSPPPPNVSGYVYFIFSTERVFRY